MAPVNVGSEGRVQPVIAKVEPILSMQKSAHLHHPHIVVGVAEVEGANVRPLANDEGQAEQQPSREDQPFPMAIEKRERPLHQLVVLALHHFSRSSR